ncbi:MAG: hypothetical protein WBW94_00305 [Anaerolineales bacterium]
MVNQKAKGKRKELWDTFDIQHHQGIDQVNKQFKFSDDDMNKLLEILLPQHLDSVAPAFQSALSRIDPTWKKGQLTIFSRHFRSNFFRSFITKRFSLLNSRYAALSKESVLEKILEASKDFESIEKAVFYGEVLSEYILRCPKERIPNWIEKYKNKLNFIVVWHLRSEIFLRIFW